MPGLQAYLARRGAIVPCQWMLPETPPSLPRHIGALDLFNKKVEGTPPPNLQPPPLPQDPPWDPPTPPVFPFHLAITLYPLRMEPRVLIWPPKGHTNGLMHEAGPAGLLALCWHWWTVPTGICPGHCVFRADRTCLVEHLCAAAVFAHWAGGCWAQIGRVSLRSLDGVS